MRGLLLSISFGVIALCVTKTSLAQNRVTPRTPDEVARAEVTCRETAGRMLSDPNVREQRRQMSVALVCPDTGAALLAARWQIPPTDPPTLEVLAGTSARMPDARILESTLSVLAKSELATQVRIRALETVVGQLGVSLTFGPVIEQFSKDLGTGVVTAHEMVQMSVRPSIELFEGKLPITAGLRVSALQRLENIERATSDKYLRMALQQARSIVKPP